MLSNLTRRPLGFVTLLSVFSKIKCLMLCGNGSRASDAVMANRLRVSSFVGTTQSHPASPDKGRKSTDDSSFSLIKRFCCSVAQSCPTLCDPMDCSMSGFLVLCYLLEFAQTHVHWADDAIQPSHPLLPPSPPSLSLFSCQGLSQ